MSDDTLFDQVLTKLPPGSAVLDLGSGTGQPFPMRYADRLARQGFAVIAVDQRPVPTTLDPAVQFIQSKVEDYLAHNQRRFDLVICSNILQFVVPDAIPKIAEAMAPRGFLFTRTFVGNRPTVHELEQMLRPMVVVNQRRYQITDDHPPEGRHTHDIVEAVLQCLPP